MNYGSFVLFQHDDAAMVEQMMAFMDENTMNGEWNLIRTESDDPFVIGDAPVVTSERTASNELALAKGSAGQMWRFYCLCHRRFACMCFRVWNARGFGKMPKPLEVKAAQAAFSTDHCFANGRSGALDQLLQERFGEIQLGVNGFAVRNRDYRKMLFDILMNRGRLVEPLRYAADGGYPPRVRVVF